MGGVGWASGPGSQGAGRQAPGAQVEGDTDQVGRYRRLPSWAGPGASQTGVCWELVKAGLWACSGLGGVGNGVGERVWVHAVWARPCVSFWECLSSAHVACVLQRVSPLLPDNPTPSNTPHAPLGCTPQAELNVRVLDGSLGFWGYRAVLPQVE